MRYTKKDHQQWLNGIPVEMDDLRSNGGLIPDRMRDRLGDWMRKNDPVAFEVSFRERQEQEAES